MYSSKAIWAIVLVSAILPLAYGDVVLDVVKEPLVTGTEYHILPVNGGGIGLKKRINDSCPFYVVYNGENDGLPVVFTPYKYVKAISEGADLKVEAAAVTTCVQSTRWRIQFDLELNKYFVYAGTSSSSSSIDIDLDYFQIVKSEGTDQDDDNVYVLSFCPSVCDICRPVCGSLATYNDEDGNQWLVIDSDNNPLKVQFRRA